MSGKPSSTATQMETWKRLGANIQWLLVTGLDSKSISQLIQGQVMPSGGLGGYDSHCHGQDHLEAYDQSQVKAKWGVCSVCFREDVKVFC